MPSNMDEQGREKRNDGGFAAAPGHAPGKAQGQAQERAQGLAHEHAQGPASGVAENEESKTGYETRDANTMGVLAFLAALAMVLAFVFLLTWGLFRQFSASQPARAFDQQRGPAPDFANVRELPGGPVLQVTPREDLERVLAGQEQKLESYGWENRPAGTVRVPIERAMDLLVQKGLPAAKPAATAGGTPGARDEVKGAAAAPRGGGNGGSAGGETGSGPVGR